MDCYTTGFLQHILSRIMLQLPKDKQLRLRKLKHKPSLEQSLLGDLCVRIEAAKRRQIPLNKLVFQTNGYGKPFLQSDRIFHLQCVALRSCPVTQIHPQCRHNNHPIVFYLTFDTKPPSIKLLIEGGFVSQRSSDNLLTPLSSNN